MSRGDGVKLWTGNELSASPLLDYKTIFFNQSLLQAYQKLKRAINLSVTGNNTV